MTARERAFAAEQAGNAGAPVRAGEPVAFLPMEALNGDVGRVAREVVLETGYCRAPLASLRSRRGYSTGLPLRGLPAQKIWTGSRTGGTATA